MPLLVSPCSIHTPQISSTCLCFPQDMTRNSIDEGKLLFPALCNYPQLNFTVNGIYCQGTPRFLPPKLRSYNSEAPHSHASEAPEFRTPTHPHLRSGSGSETTHARHPGSGRRSAACRVGTYWVSTLTVVKRSIIRAHWQCGTLDFSLWFSPLSGEIPLHCMSTWFMWTLVFPSVSLCDSVTSTVHEGCPYTADLDSFQCDVFNYGRLLPWFIAKKKHWILVAINMQTMMICVYDSLSQNVLTHRHIYEVRVPMLCIFWLSHCVTF